MTEILEKVADPSNWRRFTIWQEGETGMTDEELRIKIAELKGIEYDIYDFVVGSPILVHKNSNDDIPDWPAKIEDAWGLVEDIGLSVMKCESGYIAGRFDLDPQYLDEELGIVDSHFSRGYAVADTAPRAICLAYLKFRENNDKRG